MIITNSSLTVEIAGRGAELQSIRDSSGIEYLWQADETYWAKRAPNLFPYIARLTNKTYTLHGKEYQLPIHGFLPGSTTKVASAEKDRCVMTLEDSPQTREIYPFAFLLELSYTLCENTLDVCYTVHNRSDETMYYAVGGHPGFRVPVEDGYSFEDCFVQFDSDAAPKHIQFSPDCFVTGDEQALRLEAGNVLPLRHTLFDNDAVVMRDYGKSVTIVYGKSGRSVRMDCGDFEYFGIWHKPKTDAPFICLEPWSSLPSRKGVVEELSEQPSILSLAAGGTAQKHWSVTFTKI